jgi:hypothetical protein
MSLSPPPPPSLSFISFYCFFYFSELRVVRCAISLFRRGVFLNRKARPPQVQALCLVPRIPFSHILPSRLSEISFARARCADLLLLLLLPAAKMLPRQQLASGGCGAQDVGQVHEDRGRVAAHQRARQVHRPQLLQPRQRRHVRDPPDVYLF